MRDLFSVVSLFKKTVFFKNGGGLLLIALILVALPLTVLLLPRFSTLTSPTKPVIFRITESVETQVSGSFRDDGDECDFFDNDCDEWRCVGNDRVYYHFNNVSLSQSEQQRETCDAGSTCKRVSNPSKGVACFTTRNLCQTFQDCTDNNTCTNDECYNGLCLHPVNQGMIGQVCNPSTNSVCDAYGACVAGGGGVSPTPLPSPTPGGGGDACSNIAGYNPASMACINYYGNDYFPEGNASSPATCQQSCQNDLNCAAWTWVRPGVQGSGAHCYLKNPNPGSVPNSPADCCISGAKESTGGGGTTDGDTCSANNQVMCNNQCWELSCSAGKPVCNNGVVGCPQTPTQPVPTGGTGGGGSLCPSLGGFDSCVALANQRFGRTDCICNSTCTEITCGGGGTGVNPPTATVTGRPPTATVTTKPPTATATRGPGQPTATNTVAPTQGIQPTATTAPNQPTATPTLAPNDTRIAMSFSLPGVNKDVANGGNPNPVKNVIIAEIELFNSQGQKVKSASGEFRIFPTNTKTVLFDGEVSLGSGFQTGSYLAKIRTDNTLWKKAYGFVQIVSGQRNIHPNLDLINLVSGDLDQDNELNLIDYNIMLSCYGGKACAQKTQSDLNMDGKVDEKDLNILYAEFATRQGD